MKRGNIIKMINMYGYIGATKKLRMKGYTKFEILNMTEFLFKKVT